MDPALTRTGLLQHVWYGRAFTCCLTTAMLYRQGTRPVRVGVSFTEYLFFPAHSARLASFHCNGRPRARAPANTPIIITIITANIHANTKNSTSTQGTQHLQTKSKGDQIKLNQVYWVRRR